MSVYTGCCNLCDFLENGKCDFNVNLVSYVVENGESMKNNANFVTFSGILEIHTNFVIFNG